MKKSFTSNIFVDDRDNREYKIKDIGSGVIWFMEDLAYNAKTKYTWTEANTACPTGWRLPSDADWGTLKSVWGSNRYSFGDGSAWSSSEYSTISAYR